MGQPATASDQTGQPASATTGVNAANGSRLHFLDNLRTITILLVLVFHAGGVYESSGIWAQFWLVSDPATNDLVGLLNIVLDIVMMPAMFFIAGYVTPISLESRTSWSFMGSRFQRLIIPWAVAALALIPVYRFIFLYSRGLPQESWTTYFHFSNGSISQNWLWFLPVLFAFNGLYVLLVRMDWAPRTVSLRYAIATTFLVGFATSFGMEMLGLKGWTLTAIVDFQNERLLTYFLVFLLGALSFRQQIFASGPGGKAIYIFLNCVYWIPVTLYIVFLLVPYVAEDGVLISSLVDRLIYWLCFYLSMLCLLWLMIETFWRYFGRAGRLWRILKQNSYYVYIVHVIVLGSIGVLLLNAAIPSLLKYVILAGSTYAASNAIAWLGRRAVCGAARMRRP
jgi:hypothetical protein